MENSSTYEEIFSSLGGKIVTFLEISSIQNFLKTALRKLILDVGTGTGRIACLLVKSGGTVIGIDIDNQRLKTALEKIRSKSKNKIFNYHPILADGQHLPFRINSFDALISVRMLKYLKNPNLSLYEFARTLKPKGVAIIEFSNIFGYEGLWRFMLKILGARPILQGAQNMGVKYHLFNIFKGEKLLKELNLSIVQKRAWHKIPNILLTKCRWKVGLKFLLLLDLALRKITPTFLLSRGILVKCIKSAKR